MKRWWDDSELPGMDRVRGSRRGRRMERGDWMIRRETRDCLDERAPGIAAKMIFGENTFRDQTEVPLNAIAFHGMEVGTLPKIIAAKSPTARRQVIAMMELVTVSPYFATLGSVAPLAAPGRPNKKNE